MLAMFCGSKHLVVVAGASDAFVGLASLTAFRYYPAMRYSSLALALAFSSFAVAQSAFAEAREHEFSLDLSPLFNVKEVFAITPEALETQFAKEGFKENPYLRWDSKRSVASFSQHPYSNIEVHLSLLEGKVSLTGARLGFQEGKAQTVSFSGKAGDAAALKEKVSGLLGCQPTSGPRPLLGWKGDAAGNTSLWTSDKGIGLLTETASAFMLAFAPAQTPPSVLAALPFSRDRENRDTSAPAFFVRLDQLLAAPALWSLTPESFENNVKLPGMGFKETPFYKWNTAAKDSVLLTRHVFSNTSTDLLMCDDAVNAEEALIEFRNGKAGKVTVTLLTRGNSGENAASKFDQVFKATGRAMGEMLKVRPTQTVPAGRNLIKTQGYLWTTPHTLAFLEFNEDAPKGKLEFLRLKLMPGNGRAELMNLAGIGDTVTTKSKASLGSNVKKNTTSGDIYLAGVPMIDQGQKGYCVSASCARIFNYLGVKCDQDEIAELVKNDAEMGTSPSEMYSALRKIDQRYKMAVKVVKLPTGYGLKGLRESEIKLAQKGVLSKLVQDNVALGTPLLWAVSLPLRPVDVRIGLDGDGTSGKKVTDPQSGGGHMRLIIGYNTKTNDIIFTDSWGAGHEIKRMCYNDADRMTQAVFTMQPTQ